MTIEITKGENNPVTEFFSSPSDTPETDAAIKDQSKWMRPFVSTTFDGITYDSPVASLCRKLERERDEAREALRELWQTADAYIPQIDEEQTTKWHNAMALHTTLQKVK